MLRVHSGNSIQGFTEFEEDIHFDDDDPDFDHHVPAISVPIIITEANNPYVYKWMAIILDAKSGLDGLDERVRSYETVKDYLKRAVELNPEDVVSLYILGKWCFEMSKLTFLQRIIARVFYGKIPRSSFEEAYDYLLKSYEINPDNYYIPNMYLLGETCFQLNQFFKAKYYLTAAATLPPRTNFEKECASKARILLKRLDIYDISSETILFEDPF